MNYGFNKNPSYFKHSYWNNNIGASGSQFNFSSPYQVGNIPHHFNAPPVVRFSSQGPQVGRMVWGWQVNAKPCSTPPRKNNGIEVITLCGGLQPQLKYEFVPYKDGPSISTIRNDISARLLKAGQAPDIGHHVLADHERPDFMRVIRQPTREFHLAHPATADAQECINAGHKEQEHYFNSPMPFTLPEAEQALAWRNQELDNLIKARNEVEAKIKENHEWISGIQRGTRGPRSKKFLAQLRGQNHKLWQTSQALEWRCQNATTRRDETAENLQKIKQALEHNKEAYRDSIKSVERQRFPKDHVIFNDERARTDATRQEETRLAALVRQELENYSNASMPATLDEARATAESGKKHLENCVRDKNASEALYNEKQSRLEATRALLAEEWNVIAEHEVAFLEEEVAALKRSVEIQDQRIANALTRATESYRQKILGLHSKADFDTSHALAEEAQAQFFQRLANQPDDALAPAEADEGQSPAAHISPTPPVNQENRPESATTSLGKQRIPALVSLAALSSEIVDRAARRAERQANQHAVLASPGGAVSAVAEHESSAHPSSTNPPPANHAVVSTALGASALALASTNTLAASGAITGASVDLGGLAATAARTLGAEFAGAAGQMLSAPAIAIGAMLYSPKVGVGSDIVPGRSQKPIIKPKPQFGAKTPAQSINRPVTSRVPAGNGIKPPLATKPAFDRASLDAQRLQALKQATAQTGITPLSSPVAAEPFKQAAAALDKAAAALQDAACLDNPLCVGKLILGGDGRNTTETVPVADNLTGGKLENPLPIHDNKTVLISPDQRGEQGAHHTGNADSMESRDEENGRSKPNLGKDIANATVADKAELGGVSSGTPGSWEPGDEQKARNEESQKTNEIQSQDKTSPEGAEKLVWDSWQNQPKATINGRQYAQIGDRYYAQHAVDRMQPSSLGSPAGTVGPGRNVTPNMVEHVIKTGSPQNNIVDGVARTTFWSGDVGVVTENNGNVVVTILRRSGI
ncbi:hypothetical protein [Sodalis sp. dw_96]|uniref:hypothetical protein n=1 Tax=Sodalis sp. dw_96 TaxID=2719794 RepID=UPI001BD3F344|nr:hypothetical protein [Sodalis sp. dw_96]